jgi:DNA-binding LacI/PurR family transcriptional regulator
MRECGLSIDPSLLIIEPSIRMNEIRKSIQLSTKVRNSKATAVFVVSDYVALGLIRGLEALGIRIPEDISILSVNNTDYCLVTTPPLTSIDLSPRRASRQAVRLLVDMNLNGLKYSQIEVPCSIIQRETVTNL